MNSFGIAHDVAFVVYHIGIALDSLLAWMGRWRLATGLALQVAKCAIVMGKPAQEPEFMDVLGSHSDIAGMQLVGAALYMGVSVGPGAPARQWEGVLAKATSRIGDIAAAPSLMTRVLGFNTIASLFTFQAQFADFDMQVHKRYQLVVQKIACSLWQVFPDTLMTSLRTLRLPLEVRELGSMGAGAQLGMLRRSNIMTARARPDCSVDRCSGA